VEGDTSIKFFLNRECALRTCIHAENLHACLLVVDPHPCSSVFIRGSKKGKKVPEVRRPRLRAARRGQSEYAREIRKTMGSATKMLSVAVDECRAGDITVEQFDVLSRRFEATARQMVLQAREVTE